LIVTCEQCETRFRLDESRLPAKGARVRCSRCKHAFLVRPPGASPAATIDALAAEAARTAKPATPDVAWDLEEGSDPGSTIQRRSASVVPSAPGEADDESDWRFEDELPELGDSGASLDLPNGEAPALPSTPDPNESSFAHLGDPESWDLLSTTSSSASVAGALIGGLQAPSPRVAEPPAPAEPLLAPEPRTQAPPRLVEPEAAPVEPVLAPIVEPARAVRGAALAAIVLLAAIGLVGSLRSVAPRTLEAGRVTLGALAAESLRARIVDNAWAGPVVVVSGRLVNETQQPQHLGASIAVRLLDAGGAPLEGQVAIAQPSRSAARLREQNPFTPGTEAAVALAARAIAPGESIDFDAVFPNPIAAAARFAVETKALPPAPPAAATAPSAPTPSASLVPPAS
jgi:predicted Zn finger-like uncharacterized protein